jgi:hypothetical protein
MVLLLTESLDADQRELTHQHIEGCAVCSNEWSAFKETWRMMDALPELVVPARVREKFLAAAGLSEAGGPDSQSTPRNVVPFVRRPAFKWAAQAAAVVLLLGGGYFAGTKKPVEIAPTTATIDTIAPRETAGPSAIRPIALAERHVLNADALSPNIEGRPNITNVKFVDADATDGEVGVEFDISSRWFVKGNPTDKSMVRLLSYVLENEEAITPRSTAIEWVSRTYSNPANADPEIANALAKVLRTDTHEGVRIRAVETLATLPPALSAQARDALIEALRSDPNPAVRIKAVEALANMTRSGAAVDAQTVDMLRQKAGQDDENAYVRVKAAEALSNINPVQR